VDKRGLYHYHGYNKNLKKESQTLIGYAADGFELHYLEGKKPSWRLRLGSRKTPPFGNFDGTFKQDYEYLEKSGDLDQCNGANLGDKYVYFATTSFPLFPRCHWGKVYRDFFLR
jgi:hypothetical protein